MILFLSVCLFLLMFGISVALSSRFWRLPHAKIDRVLDPAVPSAQLASGQHFSWAQILESLGHSIRKGQGHDRLMRDFIRAGIYKAHAEPVFNGLRVTGAAVGLSLVAAIMFLHHSESANTIMSALAGGVAGFLLPGEILKSRIRRRRRQIERALPNALDLLTIGVEAGLGLDQAILHVSLELNRAHPEISEEFGLVHLETRAGKSRTEALRSLADRTAVREVKKLTAVLIQADRFGISFAQPEIHEIRGKDFWHFELVRLRQT